MPYTPVFTDPALEAEMLMCMGYQRVSSKFCALARLDSGWARTMARDREPWSRGKALDKLAQEVEASPARHTQYYLRTLARDCLTVPPEVSRRVVSASDNTPCAHLDKLAQQSDFMARHCTAPVPPALTDYGRAVLAASVARASSPLTSSSPSSANAARMG